MSKSKQNLGFEVIPPYTEGDLEVQQATNILSDESRTAEVGNYIRAALVFLEHRKMNNSYNLTRAFREVLTEISMLTNPQ